MKDSSEGMIGLTEDEVFEDIGKKTGSDRVLTELDIRDKKQRLLWPKKDGWSRERTTRIFGDSVRESNTDHEPIPTGGNQILCYHSSLYCRASQIHVSRALQQ